MGAIPTTVATFNKVVNNILSSEHAEDLINELREESEFLVDADHSHWTWTELQRLNLLDGVIKETLRLSPAEELGFGRDVMKDTITPAGLILKRGTRIALTSTAVHYDEVLYPAPTTFDPYRHLDAQNHAMRGSTVVSEESLSFGFQKHVSLSQRALAVVIRRG